MVQLRLINKIIFISLFLLLFSCQENFIEKEKRAKVFLDKEILKFCSKRKINIKNKVQDTIFTHSHLDNENLSFDLTYFSIYNKDTVCISATLYTDNGEVRFWEVRNLHYWKK